MQFEEQTISVLSVSNEREDIQAVVGMGSGLAYYEGAEGYILTTIHPGYAVVGLSTLTTIFNIDAASNETVVQHFIEQISPLLDWGEEASLLRQQAQERYPRGMYQELKKIFGKVVEQVSMQTKPQV